MNTGYTDNIKSWLKENLSEERYSHTIGTAEQAKELAEMYGLDPERAYLAGLLHDCAKCVVNGELLEIIKKEMFDIPECELSNYKTLHAPVSEHFARTKFNVSDPEILSAIRVHTLGKLDMSLFEQIVFLADKIEPNTRDLKFRDEVLLILKNNEGQKGIDLALLKCFKSTIISLVKRNLEICPVTIDVYNSLLERVCVL